MILVWRCQRYFPEWTRRTEGSQIFQAANQGIEGDGLQAGRRAFAKALWGLEALGVKICCCFVPSFFKAICGAASEEG